MINELPNLLVTFTFKFRLEDAHVRQVTLSNHMQFHDNILMICFLQHIQHLNIPIYLSCKVTMAMTFIMVNKYDINFYSLYSELNKITFVHVSTSYMSMYFDILYNNFFNFSDIARARFPVLICLQ